MNLTQMLPFEKNRYYPGKMLTTPDFRTEQQYMVHKRMFLNQMVLGSGILCGLNVLDLDGLNILVESGAAIDPLGRELVLETSVVKQLSALDGYREDTEVFSLCLGYREIETKPVYVVNRGEEQDEYENNRIEEGWKIFLVDARTAGQEFRLDSEFFVESVLSQDKDFRLTVRIPAAACRGRRIRLTVEAEKLSGRRKELSFSYFVQMPGFTAKDGSHCMEIREEGIVLEKGEKSSFDYWIYAEPLPVGETSLLFRPPKGRELELKVFLTEEEPEMVIRRSLGRTSLEIREGESSQPYIRLADLYMTRTRTACVIDRIEQEQIRKYISLPADEEKRARFRACYMEGGWDSPDKRVGINSLFPDEPTQTDGRLGEKESCSGKREHDLEKSKTPGEEAGESQAETGISKESETDSENKGIWNRGTASVFREGGYPVMTEGSLEIPLPEKAKKGTVCFSEEICHGLGPGPVWITTGVEKRKEGVNSKGAVESTVYGDYALFAQKDGAGALRTAVKVWEERGSFQAAVRLTGEQNTVLVPLHWIAVRLPRQREEENFVSEKMELVPEEATVSLRPGEKYYFEVKFRGMEPCPLKYELTEEESGRLDEDGVYTAPVKSGVYEIRISCRENPGIRTYVYAIVSR